MLQADSSRAQAPDRPDSQPGVRDSPWCRHTAGVIQVLFLSHCGLFRGLPSVQLTGVRCAVEGGCEHGMQVYVATADLDTTLARISDLGTRPLVRLCPLLCLPCYGLLTMS